MALVTINVALPGWSRMSTGTWLGVVTSRSRLVSQAARKPSVSTRPPARARVRPTRVAMRVIGSVAQVEGQAVVEQLGQVRLVDQRRRPSRRIRDELALGIDAGVGRPGVDVPRRGGDAERFGASPGG